MDYAKSLIEKKAGKNAAAAERATSGSDDIDDDAEEESWTFVGEGDDEDSDVDAALKHASFLTSPSSFGSSSPNKTLGSRALMGSNQVLPNLASLSRSPLKMATTSSISISGNDPSLTSAEKQVR